MINRCPKCKINLNDKSYNIKERDANTLSLKLLFGEISPKFHNHHVPSPDNCDLCGATIKEIILDKLDSYPLF